MKKIDQWFFFLVTCLSSLSWASDTVTVNNVIKFNNSGIPVVTYELTIPNDKEKYLTIYSNGNAPVFHLQTNKNEWLIDGKNGKIWEGTADELFQNYTRIDAWNPSHNLKSSGANELLIKHLQKTGCFDFNFRCSTLVDADYTIYISSNFTTIQPTTFGSQKKEVLSVRYVDYSKVFQHLEYFFSGDEEYNSELVHQESVRDAIAYAGRYSWRERYIDALRKLKEPVRFSRFMKSLGQHPEIMSLPFVGEDSKIESFNGTLTAVSYNYINVPREFSIAMCRLRAENKAQELLLESSSSNKDAGLLELVSDCADYSTFVSASFMEVSREKTTLLATKLRKQSDYYKGEVKADILAHACWLDVKACIKPKPLRKKRSPSLVKVEKKKTSPVSKIDVVINNDPIEEYAYDPKEIVTSIATINTKDIIVKKSAPSEWALIAKMDNQLALLDFDETKVGLTPDDSAIDNLMFFARPVGDAKDGKFMVKSFSKKRSPVPLSQGNYRVKIGLSVNFEREDRCAKGLSCIFEQAKTRSKKTSRSSVFYIGLNTGWSDEKLVSFGSLVPLIADGSSRYASTLKDVRMIIRSASFELN